MISSIPKWLGDLFEGTLRPNVKIRDTTYLSPKIKKIRFQGNVSRLNIPMGYANVIRVSETEFRNYTLIHHDTENDIFDIVFHIHGNGVGSHYINGLTKNDELYISPPRGKKLYEPSVKKQFIFGDETSLGFASSILPSLKEYKHQYLFCFELEEENHNVPQLLGLDQYVVFQKNNSFSNENWINKLPIFETDNWLDANFILTGNITSIRIFKKILKEKKVNRILSQGYWLEGKKGI
nr:FAD-binding oxidoreductase [uncultured Flavobacterium sp.]